MRQDMSQLSPMSELRLLIVLNGVDVTPRLNTLECETWEKKEWGETQSLVSLQGLQPLENKEKVIRFGEPMCVLEMLVKGTACLPRRTGGIPGRVTGTGYVSISKHCLNTQGATTELCTKQGHHTWPCTLGHTVEGSFRSRL